MCFGLQAISDDNFHVGFNKIYDVNLARSLRNIFKSHAHLFKGLEGKYDLKMAENATSIREFDDAITRVTFGNASHSTQIQGSLLVMQLCCTTTWVTFGNVTYAAQPHGKVLVMHLLLHTHTGHL